MSLNDISQKFTNETLDKIIQSVGGIKHRSWKFLGDFKKGDSYLSCLFRMNIKGIKSDGEEIEVNLVIKAIPKNIGRQKTFRSTDFFRNECNFFEIVIPKFIDFQNQRKIANPFNEFPRCFSALTDGINDYIALDDISKYGFGTAARQNGLDFKHCEIIMKLLGRFHGVSIAIKDQEPEEFKKIVNSIEETYYAEKFREWYKPFLQDQIIVATDAVSKQFPNSEIEKKMKAFTGSKLYDNMVSLTHTTNNYSVILHGDTWTPNFLMKYKSSDNGEKVPTEVKLLDFQLVRHASPALDISFFIYSCTTQELREKYYDQLIRAYHTSLTDLVRDLGSDPEKVFPFSALEEELKSSARFGCGMAMESLPLSLMEDAETPDLDNIEGNEPIQLNHIWIIKPLTDEESRQRLADVFKHAVERGYLD